MPNGSVDIAQPYGGGYKLTPTGDLALLIDTADDPAATTQRATRVLFTTPTLTDNSGNPIAYPDDVNNPNFGAGLPALVGENITDSLETDLGARVKSAFASDPGIVANPAPTVSVSGDSNGELIVRTTLQTRAGQSVTIPYTPR